MKPVSPLVVNPSIRVSVRNGGLSYEAVLHAWVVFCVKRSFTPGWSFVWSSPSRLGGLLCEAVLHAWVDFCVKRSFTHRLSFVWLFTRRGCHSVNVLWEKIMCYSVNTELSLLAVSRVPVSTRLSSGRFFGQALWTMDLGPCFEQLRVQELCESRGGRPGLPSLISLRFLWM